MKNPIMRRAGSLFLCLLFAFTLTAALPLRARAAEEDAAYTVDSGATFVQGFDQLDKNGKVVATNIKVYDPAVGKLRLRTNLQTGSGAVRISGGGTGFTLADNLRVSEDGSNTFDIPVSAAAPDGVYGTTRTYLVRVGSGYAPITVRDRTTLTLKRGSGGEAPKAGGKVTSLKLSQTKLGLALGRSSRVTVASVKPAGASKAVTWKSSNPKVVKVNASGKVTAVKRGKATITATAKDGSKKTAKLKVTVYPKSKSVQYTKKKTLSVGKSATLKAKVLPKTACQTVTYTSSNPAVAKVTAKGKITALSPGSATITATTADGMKKKAKLRLTVKA